MVKTGCSACGVCVSSYEIESNRALCRSSCARTRVGAVPPRVLRACRLPRRLKHSYTSLPIWGLNSCSTDRGSSDRSTWWQEQPVKPRVGHPGGLRAGQRPCSGNLAAYCADRKGSDRGQQESTGSADRSAAQETAASRRAGTDHQSHSRTRLSVVREGGLEH